MFLFKGSGWKLIEGRIEGQTQIDSPGFNRFTYWCHPVDVHFATKGIQGKYISSLLWVACKLNTTRPNNAKIFLYYY